MCYVQPPTRQISFCRAAQCTTIEDTATLTLTSLSHYNPHPRHVNNTTMEKFRLILTNIARVRCGQQFGNVVRISEVAAR